jgi:phosphonate transport system substrate-binding protein
MIHIVATTIARWKVRAHEPFSLRYNEGMSAITLAVVPSSTPGDSRAALEAVCQELSKQLKREVRGTHPESYSALVSELEKDRVQYAWMSPALLVLSDENIQLRPLLSAVRGNRTDYCAALFVDAAKPIHKLDELAGKTVAWVDPTSASYLYPRLHLAARGVDPSQLFGEELFLRSHAEVVRAVFDGRADVGATYAEKPVKDQPIERAGFCDVMPDRPARVLEWTQPIPNDVIAGHGLLSKPDHRSFGNAILTLAERPNGRQLLYNAFHAERFMTTPRGALKPLFELVRLARSRGLFPHL